MNTLYFITGKANVEAFDDELFDEININSLHKKEFNTREDRLSFSMGMHAVGTEHYTILSEDEYKQLTE